MRGIDAERIKPTDEIGEYRHPYEQQHNGEAGGPEQVAPREERQPAPAMRRMSAGVPQFAIVVDHGQVAVLLVRITDARIDHSVVMSTVKLASTTTTAISIAEFCTIG